MKQLRPFPFVLWALLLAFPLFGQAQTIPGTVRAFNVVGNVSLRNDSTGAVVPVTTGMVFTEGFTVISGPASSATLVQSNGATILVEPDTSLSIETFLQDSFDQSQGTYSQLKADPSTSKTRLRLNYGDASGNVKKLRSTSSYNVDLPTGSAGIRGTTWRVSVKINFQTGQISVIVANADGGVEYVSNNGVVTPVPSGTEVETAASFDPARVAAAQGTGVGELPDNTTVEIATITADQLDPALIAQLVTAVTTATETAIQQQLAAGDPGAGPPGPGEPTAEPPTVENITEAIQATVPNDVQDAVDEFSPAGGE